MSRNALKGIEPQTCLDDLESFYYVLVYIARIHMRAKFSQRPLPPYPRAHFAKHGFLFHKFEYVIDSRLGRLFQTLLDRLDSVFRNILIQDFLSDGRDEPTPVVNHEEIYNVMLSHVRHAIDDLNRETQDGVTTPRRSNHETNIDTRREDGPSSSVKTLAWTLAKNRVRRKRAILQVSPQVLVGSLCAHADAIKPHTLAVSPDTLSTGHGSDEIDVYPLMLV